ncbi:phytanoyl-CoA dioxygenase family protein [Pseudomonas aeruginosa]|nr:phytanoyl-CoA dioxygenase family protein [Pseudomonas aeruginosa]
MGNSQQPDSGLSQEQINTFISDGYVKIDRAFSKELADRCRAILWEDTGCDPNDPTTWTKPVVWLWDYAQPPFKEAANTTALHHAFDQLVGEGKWQPRESIGTFPVRFPAKDDTNDTGWHVDASFPPPGADPKDYSDFTKWRVNVRSDGRALLMLFLFSDIEEKDAPTRIRVGSHLRIARYLAPFGEDGTSNIDTTVSDGCPETLATGAAGTVYLCHPFLVHAAQVNRGTMPRFMAQPPLFPNGRFELDRESGEYSPVELAIRRALEGSPG